MLCLKRKKRVLCILTLIQKLLTTLLISCIKVIPSNEASYEITLQLHIVPGKLEQQGWTVIFTLNYTRERMKNHSFHWTLFRFYNYWCCHIFWSGWFSQIKFTKPNLFLSCHLNKELNRTESLLHIMVLWCCFNMSENMKLD